MAVIPSKYQVLESVVRYQALGKLAQLAEQVADKKRLTSEEALALRKKATTIRLWLKALDYGDYLTKEQRDKIKYALIDLADVNDFGTAPIINQTSRPNILVGGSTTIINNITYAGGTPVENLDVDTGTEDIFTLATSTGTGLLFLYTATNGTAYRTGQLLVTWNGDAADTADCSDITSPDVGGSTDDLVLDVDIDSGNVRVRATAASNNWQVFGQYFLN